MLYTITLDKPIEIFDAKAIIINGEWEMHRSGKLFRYDTNYHLFEEVNNT